MRAASVSELFLPDEAATVRLGEALARLLRPGDIVALRGDLGVGKTRLARAVIESLAGAGEEVPSPTFTLVQTYDAPVGTVWHLDLYRLRSPEEAIELGIEEAFTEGIVLIEWPDRLGPLLPADRLDVTLSLPESSNADARRAELVGHGAWGERAGALATGASVSAFADA